MSDYLSNYLFCEKYVSHPEFYKSCIEVLAPKLHELYLAVLKASSLPNSMLRAIITVLPKPGKKELCSSYHPIAQLNVDTKILSKFLATRLKIILPLIYSGQSSFMPGKNTGYLLYWPPPRPHALRWMRRRPLIQWNGPTCGKFWDSLGLTLFSWLQILYANPKAKIRIGEQLSQEFSLYHGTQQGCPLSLNPALWASHGIKSLQDIIFRGKFLTFDALRPVSIYPYLPGV